MKGQTGASMGGGELSPARRKRQARGRRAEERSWAARSGPVEVRAADVCANCGQPSIYTIRLLAQQPAWPAFEVRSCEGCYPELRGVIEEETGAVLPVCGENCSG